SHVPLADELASSLQRIKNRALTLLKAAQSRQKMYADKSRRDELFEIGEEVMVSLTHLNPEVYRNSPSRKLLNRFAGPYKILERIGEVAYRLKLPSDLKVHPVFHVSVLK